MQIRVQADYLPVHAKRGDAGIDLRTVSQTIVKPNELRTVDTGFRCEIPEGYFGLLLPRSSLATRYGMAMVPGVIDSGYRGTIKAQLRNIEPKKVTIPPHERICQLIVIPCAHIECVPGVLSDTDRGEGGFGSTG